MCPIFLVWENTAEPFNWTHSNKCTLTEKQVTAGMASMCQNYGCVYSRVYYLNGRIGVLVELFAIHCLLCLTAVNCRLFAHLHSSTFEHCVPVALTRTIHEIRRRVLCGVIAVVVCSVVQITCCPALRHSPRRRLICAQRKTGKAKKKSTRSRSSRMKHAGNREGLWVND